MITTEDQDLAEEVKRITGGDPGHVADSDPGLCSPIYRGFRLACTGGEIPALQRRIGWNARHAEASTPSEREAFDILERGMRFAPRDWQ